MNMIPLTLEWDFITPMVVPDQPMHVDGLLAWQQVQNTTFEGHPEPISTQHDLPLDRYVGSDGQWCFKASWIELIEPLGDATVLHFSKRTEAVNWMKAHETGVLGKKVPIFDPARGFSKSASLTYRIQLYTKARAHVVGDPVQLQQLISGITSIGKLRRRGMGRVQPGRVLNSEDAESQRWTRRYLPTSALTDKNRSVSDFVITTGSLLPPYHRAEGFQKILMPV